MRTRPLGRSGIEVGPLALGGNVFGWTIDEAASCRVLDAFVASGLTLIDTADVYSVWVPGHAGGESEAVIGNWLLRSGARGRVVVATKVGMEVAPGEAGLSRAYILTSAERSLNRLGVNAIDLYQAHKDDPDTPLEETLGAFGKLVARGKVRAIGASNYSGARLAEALAVSQRRSGVRRRMLQINERCVSRQQSRSLRRQSNETRPCPTRFATASTPFAAATTMPRAAGPGPSPRTRPATAPTSGGSRKT